MGDHGRDDALDYHSGGRPGKTQAVRRQPPSQPRILALAYPPGVAKPCLEIAKHPGDIYKYTNRGNLVAVISNGTAVLGLGNIGPGAGKPVMEGKAVLFKRFADIDVFDLEVDTRDTEKFIEAVKVLEPTFGGINLEDIAAPECFEIEERLKREMKIPVFHDDQHGTAIISAAALMNALEVAGKKIEKVRLVISGAGAAAMGCLRLYIKLGMRKENVVLADSHGVIYKGRTADMTPNKEEFASDTKARTLAEAMKGADVFIGLSVGGIVTKEMVQAMAKNPIVFAMANPDPEITYDDACAARSDVIMATGRSDYPNQVNNVLGFPFIFRGALDCRATTINDEMKLAAAQALADLAKEEVPDSVLRAYSTDRFSFGRDYLIPKPFDHRVLLNVPVAVSRAAAETDVALEPIADYDAYRRRLEKLLGRARGVMHGLYDRAKSDPKRIVFPEGDQEKIIRAAKILIDEGLAEPILLVREEIAWPLLTKHNIDRSKITIIDINRSDKFEKYAHRFHQLRRRRGVTIDDARRILNSRNYFAMMMVEQGDADGVIAGLHAYYPATVRPALQIIKTKPVVDGEMQADTAVVPYIAHEDYPWSTIQGDANVLIFPNLDAANAAYKLLWRVGGAEVIGPILQGLAKPVHVLQRGVDVNDIVNMAAIAVIDAQLSERPLLRKARR